MQWQNAVALFLQSAHLQRFKLPPTLSLTSKQRGMETSSQTVSSLNWPNQNCNLKYVLFLTELKKKILENHATYSCALHSEEVSRGRLVAVDVGVSIV